MSWLRPHAGRTLLVLAMLGAPLLSAASAEEPHVRSDELSRVASIVPPTWRELPRLALQATTVARVADPELWFRSRAWGDPALGCFLLAVEARIPVVDPGQAPAINEAVRRALADMDMTDPAPRDPAGEPGAQSADSGAGGAWTRIPVASRGLRGQVSVTSSRSADDAIDHLRALACFYSQREPTLSARLCEHLLHQLENAP